MKYVCLVYIDEKYVQAMTRSEVDALMAEILSYNEALQSSSRLISAANLHPSQTATTIRLRKGKASIIDGPYAETKEVLGGFYLIEARDLNEALQVASRSPSLHIGSLEVRPVEAVIEP